MTSERDCYVYIVPPGATEFVTAGRFRWIDDGAAAVGQFVYGRSYRERADAVEFDPVELRLSAQGYETARMQGLFGAIRDSMPDFWGRRVIERNSGAPVLSEFDYLMQGPDDRAGALGFGPTVEPPAARPRSTERWILPRCSGRPIRSSATIGSAWGPPRRGSRNCSCSARRWAGHGPRRWWSTRALSGSPSSAAATTAGTMRGSSTACSPLPAHAA